MSMISWRRVVFFLVAFARCITTIPGTDRDSFPLCLALSGGREVADPTILQRYLTDSGEGQAPSTARVIGRVTNRLRDCYRTNADAAAQMAIRFTIDSAGILNDARIVLSSGENAVDACALKIVRALRFASGSANHDAELRLRPNGDAGECGQAWRPEAPVQMF